MRRRPFFLSASICLLAAVSPSQAATYNWQSITANWSVASAWGGVAPTGLNATDVLSFGGNVFTPWSATNDLAANPFLLNQILITATDPSLTGNSQTISGNGLRFAGPSPVIDIGDTGGLNINMAVDLPNGLTIQGNGTGRVTINGGISGFGTITKVGAGVLRFGTLPPGTGLTAPSTNTWMGTLNLSSGSVTFNNNAQSGSTALRANPVVLSTGTTLLLKRNQSDESSLYDTSLRLGTLSGNGGSVFARVVDESAGQNKSVSNYDIVITALSNGSYAGSLTLEGPVSHDLANPGNDGGKFIVRGTGVQEITGALSIWKDVIVGRGATLKLGGIASLGSQTQGAVVLAGGTVILDNTGGNIASTGRLRDGTTGSTGVESTGGGTLSLVGNLSGTTEVASRLQLGTSSAGLNRPRAGALTLNVTPATGATGATELKFQSYVRKEDLGAQFSTVDFTATDAAGAAKTLGQSGNNPRIYLTNSGAFSVPTSNGLLSVTAGIASVGWATVNGESFAAYDVINGVTAASTVAWPGASASDNTLVTANATVPGTGYAVNTIKMAPVSAGQSLNLTGTGNLSSAAYLLAGGVDFIIKSTGGGGLGGTTTRFFQVQQATLTVQANLAPLPLATDNRAVVKAGAGVLELTNPGNINQVTPLAINAGTVRANYTTGALPNGEIQFRGGVLELAGGGTFFRPLGLATSPSTASVNWSGTTTVTQAGDDDRGSGGFAAFGADVTIDLSSSLSRISWEDSGFVRSGYALVFGSRTATNRVTWSDDLGLTDANSTVDNYNAREVRVVNNPNSTGDWARITGNISGSLYNDLLKTGDGTLELANGTANSYLGATIVQEGTLLVNTNNETSFAHDVKSGGILGGNGRLGNVKVEDGGILAPGNLPGRSSLLRTKDLHFTGSGSILQIEAGGLTPGGDGTTGYDQLSVTGSVDLNNVTLDLKTLGAFQFHTGDLLFLILNDGLDAVTGQFSQGNFFVLGSQTFLISYAASSESVNFTGGNDVAIQAVPEPSGLLWLGVGALGLLRRRRAAK